MNSIERQLENFSHSIQPDSKVLDLGCGLRPYEKYFNNSSYTGLDVHSSGRNKETKRADVFYDGINIPFEDQSFDLIICTEVLEHALEPEILVKEMARVIKKDGGQIFLTVPFMWGEHEPPYDFRRYSSFGIKKLFSDIGMEIIHQEKLTSGIDAIDSLIKSEINYSNSIRKNNSITHTFLENLSIRIWKTTVQLWKRLYVFERVFLDNLVIAKWPSKPLR